MGDRINYTDSLLVIVILLFILIIRAGRIESALERNKPSKEVREANEQLQLWNEYRAEKEKR